MRLLIIADTLDNQRAGIHVYTKNMIKALLQYYPKNEYHFVHLQKNPLLKKLIRKSRAKAFDHIVPRKKLFGIIKLPLYDSIRRLLLIPSLARKIKADMVFEPCHIGPFNLPPEIKRLTTVHDLTPLLFPKFHPWRSVLAHRLLLKRALIKANQIFTPSYSTKNDIVKHLKIAPEKIRVIDIAPDLPTRLPKIKKTNRKYVLYLGTIEPRKNINILIDAYRELVDEKRLPRNYELILAGEIGWKVNNLIKKIGALQKKGYKIKTLGYVSDKVKFELYKNASLFVYPSFYEGYGLPPGEAMRFGVPTLLQKNPALLEVYSKTKAKFFEDKEELKKLIIKNVTPNL